MQLYRFKIIYSWIHFLKVGTDYWLIDTLGAQNNDFIKTAFQYEVPDTLDSPWKTDSRGVSE